MKGCRRQWQRAKESPGPPTLLSLFVWSKWMPLLLLPCPSCPCPPLPPSILLPTYTHAPHPEPSTHRWAPWRGRTTLGRIAAGCPRCRPTTRLPCAAPTAPRCHRRRRCRRLLTDAAAPPPSPPPRATAGERIKGPVSCGAQRIPARHGMQAGGRTSCRRPRSRKADECSTGTGCGGGAAARAAGTLLTTRGGRSQGCCGACLWCSSLPAARGGGGL